MRTIEIGVGTLFETYVAYRKDATLSSYCRHFVSSLRGHMERLAEPSSGREKSAKPRRRRRQKITSG